MRVRACFHLVAPNTNTLHVVLARGESFPLAGVSPLKPLIFLSPGHKRRLFLCSRVLGEKHLTGGNETGALKAAFNGENRLLKSRTTLVSAEFVLEDVNETLTTRD